MGKLKAQSLLDDASEFLSDVAVELPKVEEAGRPLLKEERLNSAALRGVCDATEAAVEGLDAAVAGTQAKLDEAAQVLGEELIEFFRPELLRLQGRLNGWKEQSTPVRKKVAEARERASKKEVEEERAQ